jgi:integral membrane protein
MTINDDLKVPFERYRVLAFLTGAALAFLTLVAIPYKYIFEGTGHWTAYAWQAHGWLYIVYLILTVDLGLKAKWSLGKMLVVALAGTVPFMSFVAEYKLRKELGY